MAAIDHINQNSVDYEIVPEIAPLFKTTETYVVGDHVIYQANWYTFKEAKTAGAWDATKVDGPFKVAYQKADVVDMFKAFPAETVSGSVASFSDGANVPVKSLVVDIDPVQSGSGDPSPENVRPISGHASVHLRRSGKNIFRTTLTSQTKNGTTFVVNDDGSITISGTPTSQVRVTMYSGVFWTASEVGIFSSGTMPTGTRVFCSRTRNGATTYPTISPTATAQVGDEYSTMLLEIDTSYNGVQFTIYPQIELGSIATDYEPYIGTTYPVIFPSEVGTVYGGTIDLISGVLTVNKAITTINDLTWSWNNTRSIFYAAVEESGKEKDNVIGTPIMCDSLPYKGIADSVVHAVQAIGDSGVASSVNTTHPYIYLRHNDISTQSDLKAALGTAQIVYQLATPKTYQFTPTEVRTLLGHNNIWADTGNIEVQYRADTKLYIDKKIQEALML